MAQKLILPINQMRITAAYKNSNYKKQSAIPTMESIVPIKHEKIKPFGEVEREK